MSTSSTAQTAPTAAQIWATGDYAGVADRMIPQLGERLVEVALVEAGHQVLDVAAGTGNAALPAAARGAAVTALDITPELLEVGAQRAAAAGVEVDWVHGDAEGLPFDTAAFDRVISCVGVQFCGDHPAAATELARVCRPGGRVALIAWTPGGFIGQMLAAVGKATGAAGTRPSPLVWGSEAEVSRLFADSGGEITFGTEYLLMPAESPEAWVDYMAVAYGPFVRARVALEPKGTWEALREKVIEIATAHNTGQDGGFAGQAEYLTTVIQR